MMLPSWLHYYRISFISLVILFYAHFVDRNIYINTYNNKNVLNGNIMVLSQLYDRRPWISFSVWISLGQLAEMDITKMDRGTLTLLGSGCCVMLSMHFTVQLMSQHLFYWKNPKEQKAIIIIILMAPLYAITSFVGLLDIRGSKAFFTFLESVKECYEALVCKPLLVCLYCAKYWLTRIIHVSTFLQHAGDC